MVLKSFLVVDKRDGSTFQVWAKDRKDAQLEYMSVHGNYWKDSDHAIVRLHATMEVESEAEKSNAGKFPGN